MGKIAALRWAERKRKRPFPGPSEGLKIRECQYILFGGDNLPPLVKIGLTDMPKSGGAMAPPPPPGLIPPSIV